MSGTLADSCGATCVRVSSFERRTNATAVKNDTGQATAPGRFPSNLQRLNCFQAPVPTKENATQNTAIPATASGAERPS